MQPSIQFAVEKKNQSKAKQSKPIITVIHHYEVKSPTTLFPSLSAEFIQRTQ